MGTTRPNLTTPCSSMFSFHRPTWMCGGSQGGGRCTLGPPLAAGQPEPMGLVISFYTVGEAGSWATMENEGEAPERPDTSPPTACREGEDP